MNESMYASVTPAILEFGQSYTKVGVAGEPQPRGIIKTYDLQDGYVNISQNNSLVVSKGIHWSQWKNKLYQLLHKIYFHYLRINSSEHKVCIIENPIVSIHFKKALTCVLFESFHVPSIEFLPASKVPVYLCGVTTGLVLDVGYSGTRVLPIYYDIPVYEAIELVSLKSEKVDTLLYDCLQQDPLNSKVISVLECNKAIIEPLRLKYCYVRSIEDSLTCSTEDKHLSVHIKRLDISVHFSQTSRWKPYEFLFQDETEQEETLCHAMIRSLQKCPIDVRPFVIENILLCGGIVDAVGFRERFLSEFWKLLNADKFLNTNKLLSRACISDPKPCGFLRPWVGGSLYAAVAVTVPLNSKSLEISKWKKESILLHDWIVTEDMNIDEAESSFSILKLATLHSIDIA